MPEPPPSALAVGPLERLHPLAQRLDLRGLTLRRRPQVVARGALLERGADVGHGRREPGRLLGHRPSTSSMCCAPSCSGDSISRSLLLFFFFSKKALLTPRKVGTGLEGSRGSALSRLSGERAGGGRGEGGPLFERTCRQSRPRVWWGECVRVRVVLMGGGGGNILNSTALPPGLAQAPGPRALSPVRGSAPGRGGGGAVRERA